MEAMKMKYLVTDPNTRRHIGLYEAATNDEAVALALDDKAVRPLLLVLARQALRDRIADQRRRAHEGVDRGWCDREIRRLRAEAETNPLPLLVGVLEALDTPGLVRMFRRNIEHEVENRMLRGIEIVRNDEEGTDTFESSDLHIGGYFFHARCVRHDWDMPGKSEVTIELIVPTRGEAKEPPGGPEDVQPEQGNGRMARTA
jgi:hypothetical protein